MRVILIALTLIAAPLRAVEPLSIQDNSFLIEEAYNQEPGVVQSIFTISSDDGDFVATFTNEMSLSGQRHQFSYALSALRVNGESGIGDTMLNYRYQLAGDGKARVAIAPRLSLVLPTGDEERGGGTFGYEVNLPVSIALTDRLATHWNVGVTSTEDTEWFAGGSLIAAVRERFHLMLETRWTDEELVVSPGVRWAWNLANGFQVVPGIAVPVGDETRAVFLYLSFER